MLAEIKSQTRDAFKFVEAAAVTSNEFEFKSEREKLE